MLDVVAAATARQDLADLDAIRVTHDWSFPDLARKMLDAGYGVKERTLYYLLRQLPPGASPRDTTAHRIARFVEFMRAEDERHALEREQRKRERDERAERQRRHDAELRAAQRRPAVVAERAK